MLSRDIQFLITNTTPTREIGIPTNAAIVLYAARYGIDLISFGLILERSNSTVNTIVLKIIIPNTIKMIPVIRFFVFIF